METYIVLIFSNHYQVSIGMALDKKTNVLTQV